MVKTKFKILAVLFLSAVTFLALAFGTAGMAGYAASPVGGEDGVYSCGFSVGGTSDMGASQIKKYIDSAFTVEKFGSTYYVSISYDSTALTDFTVTLDDKTVGYENLGNAAGKRTNRYTFGAENIRRAFSVTAYIPAMGRSVSFTLQADVENATFTDNNGDMSGERPAEFVPVITTDAGSEYQMQQGSVFPIPSAAAFLGAEECAVTIAVFYGEEEVSITDNCFTAEKVGEYRLIYRASSTGYKTSLGNDTYTEYEVLVTSSVGGSSLAKVEDFGGVLPEDAAIMASRITEGSALYSQAAEKMRTIADDFEVFGVKLISPDGEEVAPADDIALYLQADGTYDRTKAVVYYMDESGNLAKLNASGYGRYVKVETDKTGTFIVCIPGVAFVMPMWGYAVISVACVIVLAAAVTVTVVFVRKKKKAQPKLKP